MNRPDAVQAQAYYGTPVGGMRLSPVEGARPQAGGVPYEESIVVDLKGKCAWEQSPCGGFAVKDSAYCVGHTKSKRKQAKTEGV
jgi:hypothetical protein